MISLKLTKERTRNGKPWFRMFAIDGNNHEVIHGGGSSPKMAARWLIRNINRTVAEVEQAVVELGWLSEDEVIVVGDEEPSEEGLTSS